MVEPEKSINILSRSTKKTAQASSNASHFTNASK